MKVYNYISMLLLSGTVAFTSCSQDEEMGGENLESKGFQISVFDEGYQSLDASNARAIENDYSTKFAEGDAIGIFAVKNEMVVGEITNRKFTLQDGVWTLDDDGDPIEYKGSEYQKMSFYAYYPYNKNVTFESAKANPFETYVNNWKVGEIQNEGEYTKYDLMTSTGVVEGDRLKGKISFTMKHQMALAVLQMPKVTYSFTNANIDDYSLPVSVGSFALNNVESAPYYQKSTDTYRFLVNPNKAFSIKGTYNGVKKMEYAASGSLEGGTAKMYTIKDPNKIEYTLAIGDYFCADGRIVSKDAETVPDQVIGIVCYAGNPQPHVTNPANNSETTDALYRDYPNSKHGLVLALDDSKGTAAQFSGKGIFSTWFTSNDEWKDKFIGCNTNNATNPSVMFPGYQGYNNTTLLTMCYENGATVACDPAYTYISSYRGEVPVPASASVWYLPGLSELDLVAANMSTINASVKAAQGTALTSTNKGVLVGFYWSSNERNDSFMWLHHMDGGSEFLNRERSSRTGYFRMMLAF